MGREGPQKFALYPDRA